MKSKILDSPLGQLSDGTIVMNVTHIETNIFDVFRAAEVAIDSRRRVFVGVELTPKEASQVRKKLDQAAAEIVAVTYDQ